MASVPLSLRIDAQLKEEVDRMAREQNRSLTEITENALRQFLAQTCQQCGATREKLNPGLTPSFERWVRDHRNEAVFLIMRQDNVTCAYKGVLWLCAERTVSLSPVSGNGMPRGTFLRDQIVDWRPGIHGTGTQEFEMENPGIPVNRWGLGAP
ncbi:CopG family transcriptional regulator [Corallococcus exercitus]|uniref:CopG family transcriptional regulator n=1 Tax=Corallococcus exercitus TaxID=2316736 RepID=A0A7Y4JQM2_9BACT|nr:CopG family transcriptional regulator [Corallococcus exercitus]